MVLPFIDMTELSVDFIALEKDVLSLELYLSQLSSFPFMTGLSFQILIRLFFLIATVISLHL